MRMFDSSPHRLFGTPIGVFLLSACLMLQDGSACRTADSARSTTEIESSTGRCANEENGQGHPSSNSKDLISTAVPEPIGVPADSSGPTVPEPVSGQTVFDLIANRHLAHQQVRGGLWIDAGSPGFARYVHGNRGRDWELNQQLESHPVAIPLHSRVSLYFPLTQQQASNAREIRVQLWYQSGLHPLEASLGEEHLGEIELTAGWQTVTFPVRPGVFVPGENHLTLGLPSDATKRRNQIRGAVENVFIGPPLGVDYDYDQVPSRIGLGPDEGMAYYVVLPEAAWLRFELDGSTSAGCTLRARILEEEGLETTYDIEVSSALEAGESRIETLVLSGAPRGEVIRLELGLGEDCSRLLLTGATLEMPVEPIPRREWIRPRNVIVWLIDALRADRLRCIQPDTRVMTPNLDRFCEQGVVFTRAYVQGNSSFASHAALFTGRYPETMEVLSSRDHVEEDEELIAELMQRAGMTTGGYSSNGHIRRGNGFEQGFDHFVNTLRDNYRYLAPGLVSHASRWLDSHGSQPFYLYVGTVDCHVSYRSHEDILPLYDPRPYNGLFRRTVSGDELGRIKSGDLPVSERDRFRIEAIYDDEVTFSDRHFGQFIEDLADRRILDETLIVVLSDHGDEFWEHGSVGHGHSVYEELIHVPLILRYPAAIPPGTVIDQTVESIDLLPTLAELLGVEPNPGVQGESLVDMMLGADRAYPRPAVSQHHGHHHAMVLHEWKIFWCPDGERRLYSLRSDPTEQHDVALDHPFALRFLTDAMGLYVAYREQWRKSSWGVASNLGEGFDPRMETERSR